MTQHPSIIYYVILFIIVGLNSIQRLNSSQLYVILKLFKSEDLDLIIFIDTYVYVSKSPLFMASRIHSVIFTMSVLRAATGNRN